MTEDPRLERLSRSDWRLVAVCVAIAAASLAFSLAFFDRAFPEASIDFKFDRSTSEGVALDFLGKLGLTPGDRRHAARFDVDHAAKIYLERALGLKEAGKVMAGDVEVWAWTHRWFVPLETEELVVRVSPRGEIVSFEHRIPESEGASSVDPALRVGVATSFLESIGVDTKQLKLVSVSDRRLPSRVDSVLVWEHRSIRPGGAAYHYEVTLHGAVVGAYRQSLQVPEEWRREYASLRAKNETAGDVASVLMVITTLAALFVFVIRIRRNDIQIRYSALTGAACAVLLTLVSLNSLPSALASYDTRTSFSAFLFQHIGLAALGGVTLGLFLMVMVGAGDSMLRERLPDKLSMPLLLSPKAIRSKRVFTGSILGFTLVPAFLAYQVAFYLIADRFGAWAPAEIPYDETLNTLLPWAVVLFGGFFPAFSEEYISRAFSIPFLEKVLRRRFAAIAISAFIWGFGHSTYPNQPFFIRGLEVGMAGIVLGYVVYRFGILPALVWHYAVDAIYTSLLLVQSGNAYYAISSAVCALIFAGPLILSAVLYLRRGGFEPDAELENRTIGTATLMPPAAPDEPRSAVPRTVTPRRIIVAGVASAVVSAVLFFFLPDKLDPLARYPMSPDDAIALAAKHLGFGDESRPEKVVVFPSAGFRDWNDDEKGGAPGTYDVIAAEHIARESARPYDALRRIMSDDVPAGTWKVRFFTPGVTEEFEVEIDPRRREVTGETHRIEEGAPGATLERNAAADIAGTALARYGLDAEDFELKDTIAVPMPERRDWVFHFERTKPLAPDVWMRIDVRLAGNKIVHVGRTVRIPEDVRRLAERSTFVNTLLFFGGLAGALFVLVITGAGAVMAFRDGGLRWRSALRATLLFALPATVAGFLPFGLASRAYQTSIDWDTFIARQVLRVFESVGFQLFLMFLALLAISVCVPWATGIGSSENRRRLGLDAVTRALSGAFLISMVIFAGDALELATHIGLDVSSPVSDRATIPIPALAVAWQAVLAAACFAALSVAAPAFLDRLKSSRLKRWIELSAVVSIALFVMNSSARPADLPVEFAQALGTGLVFWLVASRVFAPNPLSVPPAMLLLFSMDEVAAWLRSGRTDLQTNAIILAAVVLVMFVWVFGRLKGAPTTEPRTPDP